jgi:hypothetical protein
MEYHNKLKKEEGISPNNALDLAISVKNLHAVLSLLPEKEVRIFLSKTIEGRLMEFAETEGLRDVTAHGSDSPQPSAQ